MKLMDLSAELNHKFNAGELDTTNMDFNSVFTDDEILDILLDELTEPTYEPELLYSQPAGHFDEQTLEQYLSMTDEDGEYLHPYNKEEFI